MPKDSDCLRATQAQIQNFLNACQAEGWLTAADAEQLVKGFKIFDDPTQLDYAATCHADRPDWPAFVAWEVGRRLELHMRAKLRDDRFKNYVFKQIAELAERRKLAAHDAIVAWVAEHPTYRELILSWVAVPSGDTPRRATSQTTATPTQSRDAVAEFRNRVDELMRNRKLTRAAAIASVVQSDPQLHTRFLAQANRPPSAQPASGATAALSEFQQIVKSIVAKGWLNFSAATELARSENPDLYRRAMTEIAQQRRRFHV